MVVIIDLQVVSPSHRTALICILTTNIYVMVVITDFAGGKSFSQNSSYLYSNYFYIDIHKTKSCHLFIYNIPELYLISKEIVSQYPKFHLCFD